jgi:hypothetical protein
MEEEVQRLKKLNDLYDKKWHEEHEGKNLHDRPSPETLKELELLKLSRVEDQKDIQFMKDEISEVKELVKDLGTKIDNAMSCKADKSEVDGMKKDIKEISNWMWKVIGIGIVGGAIMSFLGVVLFNHLTK